MIIWHATLWNIWEARNEVTFSLKIAELEEIVQGILKYHIGDGFMLRKKGGPCLYYD